MHEKAKMTDLLITLYMHAAGMTVEIMHAACIPYSSVFPSILLPYCIISFFFALSSILIQPNTSNQLWGNPHFMRACHAHRDLICPVSPCFAKIPHMLWKPQQKFQITARIKALLPFLPHATPAFLSHTPPKPTFKINHHSLKSNNNNECHPQTPSNTLPRPLASNTLVPRQSLPIFLRNCPSMPGTRPAHSYTPHQS